MFYSFLFLTLLAAYTADSSQVSNHLRNQVELMEQQLQRVHRNNIILNRRIASLKSSLSEKKNTGYLQDCAFTACQGTQTNTYQLNETLTFDLERTACADYDPVTSTFTCPGDGHYAFHVTVRAVSPQPDDEDIRVKLYFNDDPMLVVSALNGQSYRQGSGSVIVKCEAGATLKVVADMPDAISIHGSEEICSTSFSGYPVRNVLGNSTTTHLNNNPEAKFLW